LSGRTILDGPSEDLMLRIVCLVVVTLLALAAPATAQPCAGSPGQSTGTYREGMVIDITDRRRQEELAREATALREVATLAAAAHHPPREARLAPGLSPMLDIRKSSATTTPADTSVS